MALKGSKTEQCLKDACRESQPNRRYLYFAPQM